MSEFEKEHEESDAEDNSSDRKEAVNEEGSVDNDDDDDGDVEEGVADEDMDEEEALELFLRRRANREAYESDMGQSSDSDDDEEHDSPFGQDRDDTPVQLGPNASLEDLNAETQRILRATAERDRLGKGQKIEVRPLSSIVAKLKERKALAVARAPKVLSKAPTFDEVLAASMPKASDRDIEEEGGPAEADNVAPVDDDSNSGDIKTQNTTHAQQLLLNNHLQFQGDNDSDFEVVSEGEEMVVELPHQTQKAKKLDTSPLGALPFTQSAELEFIEEAPIIEDGVESDEESDIDTEYSWQVKKNEKDGEQEESDANVDFVENAKNNANNQGGARSVAPEEDYVGNDPEEVHSKEFCPMDGLNKANLEVQDDELGVLEGDDIDSEQYDNPEKKDSLEKSGLEVLIASEKENKTFQRARQKYLDMEAELSDEEGAAAPVSDDEDEDNVDDNGELADLVTADKAILSKDKIAADELHMQWARQKEAQDIQKLLRGLENGFRRGHGVGVLEADEAALDGRRRRARVDDDDDSRDAGRLWPGSIFGTGIGNTQSYEDDCEDEAMLHKAKQRRLLAASHSGTISPGDVPLDEDSQMVLDLLTKHNSESQGAGSLAEETGCIHKNQAKSNRESGTSRLNGESIVKERKNTLMHTPSFVGRQSTISKVNGSGSLGIGGSRSFIFGRNDSSNQGAEASIKAGSQGSGSEHTGPTTFANLKQMTARQNLTNTHARKANTIPTLVSRLRKDFTTDLSQSQETMDAANAVWQHVVMGATRRSSK